jgi:transcriptional regulator with XRE-family HTH domain
VPEEEKDRTVEELMGRVIRFRRKALGLTQEELAERAGLGRHAIQLYEQGLREPKASVLIRLAAALGLGVGDLLAQTSWNPPDTDRDGLMEHRPDDRFTQLPKGRNRA